MAHRLLIAAGESVTETSELPFGVRVLLDAADEILVIAPTLPSRFEWLASAIDKAEERADERLEAVLGQLSDLGAEAAGQVGADDPLLAFEDAIRQFSPDHILIALRCGGGSWMAGARPLDALHERFGLPLTTFLVSSD